MNMLNSCSFTLITAIIVLLNRTELVRSLTAANNESGNRFAARIVGIFVADSELPYTLELAKPSIDIAIEKARTKFPLIDWNDAVIRNGSTKCTSNVAGVFAAEEFYLRRVTAFIGPSCGLALDPVARMAAHWNIPVISSGGGSNKFSDKAIFSTLTRLSFSLTNLGTFLRQILELFAWKYVTMIVHENVKSPLIPLIRQSIVDTLDPVLDINLEVHEITRSLDKVNLRNILVECSKEARVIILLSTGETVRKILLTAYDLGMGSGKFAFLTVELFKHPISFGNFDWFVPNDTRNEDAKLMYRSLMVITVRVPFSGDYLKFIDDVVHKSRDEFNTSFGRNDVNIILASFHDAVLLYGQVVTEAINNNRDPLDGHYVTRLLWNRTFYGLLTGDIYLDENGDKETDYILNDFDPNTNEMKRVLCYSGYSGRIGKTYLTSIDWPNNSGPPIDPTNCELNTDDPQCVQKKGIKPYIQTFTIIIFVLLVVICVLFYIYRKLRLESELASMWWRVKWHEITFIENSERSIEASHQFSSKYCRSDNNANRICDAPQLQQQLKATFDAKNLNVMVDSVAQQQQHKSHFNSSDFPQFLPRKGLYKGIKVSIKSLNIRHITINRIVLLELKQLRDLAHENLIRFIGFCPDEPYVCILTEFCEKGNLRDLLDNDGIRIDWPFRYSLISDIVEGMSFIHDSSLNYHGRLKSTNCVIDSRLSVKLTDFGLRAIKSQLKIQNINQTEYKSLLWTAPEHLRQNRPEMCGSQKGDVYSFAIVLQEIVTRNEPFETATDRECQTLQTPLIPQLIVQQLCVTDAEIPFRPYVSEQDCSQELIELLEQCWHEMPANRPSFSQIRQQLKKIMKDIGGGNNFLENLLLRMEEYATDLEILVEQKTSAFFEEKRKCEELLYEVLPKYVADQLKVGHHVTPESFECVTIFFSDIVRFTQLSAQSTPIEIVDFLNDLYTLFDSIISNYNVYKVETVGDAYMVVSGLPIRNGDEHAREIARMSLELLEGIKRFKIKHLPDRCVQLRIGIHSGGCAAGVIGLKMPRYCLFGDTVNTASRMESHGEANKIHTSLQTKQILDKYKTFDLKLRGDIELKGKGIVRTYWLESETNNNNDNTRYDNNNFDFIESL